MKKESGLLSNLSWKFAERIIAQLVTFIVSIILARLLDPSHYGSIAIVNVFITFANVFVSDGLGSALIQKKNADVLDFSSVLYFNVFLSLLLYFCLFLIAPFISSFYGEGYEILTPVLRVLGIKLILAAINSVQHAYVSKHMIFKKFFYATLFGTIISAFVGIYMAYSGFGVWSLVAQYLTNSFIDTVVLNISLRIRLIKRFSFARVRDLFGFGIKILGSNLLITSYTQVRALIIGKLYTSKDLAYYQKANQYPELLVTNINTSIGAVLFPKMSREQDSIDKVRNTTRMSIRFSGYVMAPIMLGLLTVAKPLVLLMLTEKWLPCVPYIQLLCINYLFRPIHTANLQAIKAVGRSDIILKLEIIKKSIEIVTLLGVMWISVKAIVVNMAILATLFTIVNSFPNKKLIGYSYFEQLKDVSPPLLMAIVMAISVFAIGLLPIAAFPLLIIQIIAGVIIYAILSIISRNQEFFYICKMIETKISFRRKKATR